MILQLLTHLESIYAFQIRTFSKVPIPSSDDSVDLQESVEAFILSVVSTLPAIPNFQASLRAAQTQDEILSQVMHYGWPEKNLKGPVKKFWMTRNELSLHDDLLLHGNRVVIPITLRQEILHKLHEGHQGIVKCSLHAKESVFGQEYI